MFLNCIPNRKKTHMRTSKFSNTTLKILRTTQLELWRSIIRIDRIDDLVIMDPGYGRVIRFWKVGAQMKPKGRTEGNNLFRKSSMYVSIRVNREPSEAKSDKMRHLFHE